MTLDLPALESLFIGNRSFGDAMAFSVTNVESLSSIQIGNGCFNSVSNFLLQNLNKLTDLKIGSNSFTLEKNNIGNNSNRSFKITKCNNLKSIIIGEYSFSDYSNGFTLDNLPSLESLVIGNVGCGSWNFYFSSFVIKSMAN